MHGADAKEVPEVGTKDREVQEAVLSIEPQQKEAPGPGHGHSAEDKEPGGSGAELQDQNQEDEEQHHRQEHLQGLLGADLVLPGASEFKGDAGGQQQLPSLNSSIQRLGCSLDQVHFAPPLELVEEHVAGELGIFGLDRLWAAHEVDLGELPKGYRQGVLAHTAQEHLG